MKEFLVPSGWGSWGSPAHARFNLFFNLTFALPHQHLSFVDRQFLQRFLGRCYLYSQHSAYGQATMPPNKGVLLAHLASVFKRLHNSESKLNQSGLFSYHANLTQRVLAVSSSSVSILFCLLVLYSFLAMDRNRLIFRHQLIAFLIFFDLLKACILLLYPSRVMTHGTAYLNQRFCQVVGFFTSVAIEGADLAILSFAVHTFLLIFKPKLLVKVPGSERVEGGLYRYRYYVYGLSFVIPIVMASLAYIGIGYSSYVCWCYLPEHPVWYRLVLSWVPRYMIVVTIFLVYGLIYYHVLREFKALGGVFSHMHEQQLRRHRLANSSRITFFSSLKYSFYALKDYLYLKFVVPLASRLLLTSNGLWLGHKDSSQARSPLPTGDIDTVEPGGPLDPSDAIHDPELQAANLENFRRRQKAIEKQMKSIFVYPIAYVTVWLFPFILQCTQFNYELSHKPINWLNYLSAFMQPFNGFVDSMVFFYREQPWNYTIMKLFERENAAKMVQYARNYSLSYGDLDSSNTNPKINKCSMTAASMLDYDHYPRWRRILAYLRLPLMALPTEKSAARFHTKYMARLEEQRNENPQNADTLSVSLDFNALTSRHDFSNLLSGDLPPSDFHLAFENYLMNFQQKPDHVLPAYDRRSSVASNSNKSSRSRRLSVMDPREAIPEQSEFQPHHEAPVRRPAPAQQKRPSQRSRPSDANEDDMDFMEFLRSGH